MGFRREIERNKTSSNKKQSNNFLKGLEGNQRGIKAYEQSRAPK